MMCTAGPRPASAAKATRTHNSGIGDAMGYFESSPAKSLALQLSLAGKGKLILKYMILKYMILKCLFSKSKRLFINLIYLFKIRSELFYILTYIEDICI